MIQKLNSKNFEEHIKTGLRLVEFYTDWCGYCEKQKHIIEDLSKNGVWIGIVNADENSEITKSFGITGFPSFILFKNGRILSTLTGYHDKSLLLSKLMENIN